MKNRVVQSIDLTGPIQVHVDNIWKNAAIISVSMEDVVSDFEDNTMLCLSFDVIYDEGLGSKHISDAFGYGYDLWRYRKRCCEQCLYHSTEGGDIIPWGSSTTTTPFNIICECNNSWVELEEYEGAELYEDPVDYSNGGKDCKHFKSKLADIAHE